ncbi:type II toxin-antitoxin system VapC family toxin [Rhodopila globiformis]|uniref:Ribonuclease VapC n=1 Tax=Rhodopila globiformis TaxID=1071 RepID=A0A2S6MZD5_RHOGL|nr:type II toxin-antitoxin system VapC family toxin [Rhodopila globiformis]PPQ27706.1 PIN domain nuclease [Rhodopila globiformis]
MAFVVDASVSACWALDDEDHVTATAALDRSKTDGIIVPSLWWFEIRNLLVVAERRKRFTAAKTNTFLRSLKRLDLSIDNSPSNEAVMDLARRHGLTVYDSGYLELALRYGLPLATLDKKLAAAAAHEGTALIV